MLSLSLSPSQPFPLRLDSPSPLSPLPPRPVIAKVRVLKGRKREKGAEREAGSAADNTEIRSGPATRRQPPDTRQTSPVENDIQRRGSKFLEVLRPFVIKSFLNVSQTSFNEMANGVLVKAI